MGFKFFSSKVVKTIQTIKVTIAFVLFILIILIAFLLQDNVVPLNLPIVKRVTSFLRFQLCFET